MGANESSLVMGESSENVLKKSASFRKHDARVPKPVLGRTSTSTLQNSSNNVVPRNPMCRSKSSGPVVENTERYRKEQEEIYLLRRATEAWIKNDHEEIQRCESAIRVELVDPREEKRSDLEKEVLYLRRQLEKRNSETLRLLTHEEDGRDKSGKIFQSIYESKYSPSHALNPAVETA
mmetsp:Transcript_1587/g.2455  ORF Transcript_1587/g.2455 Transcript_1587/m.2455 type:complete len:178 (+) Transcript_1587:255-788(+)|eukprot:CAMPEP_0203754296 /NCGR_PEP_ID=MMETSP0098-20131031/7908_1 /ASSEMBLY_ACC=CAM_ASM_000208 /TAXON_ID=96639 /ORGANISM=" , Strain NY0313808BC1" /LENGTH=177 /DNA_ID=CAMNT_0050645225 /DNA_START=223 /DNA_END=756 /DNA_ORIENTATION=+